MLEIAVEKARPESRSGLLLSPIRISKKGVKTVTNRPGLVTSDTNHTQQKTVRNLLNQQRMFVFIFSRFDVTYLTDQAPLVASRSI
jgi:hypothetical protein